MSTGTGAEEYAIELFVEPRLAGFVDNDFIVRNFPGALAGRAEISLVAITIADADGTLDDSFDRHI
jgi:hypothetical protein